MSNGKWSLLCLWLFSLVICTPHAAKADLLSVPNAPTGSFDGSYDPASQNPPARQSTWLKTENAGLRIKVNFPERGQAEFADTVCAVSSANLNICRRLDREKDWHGDVEDREYEFSVRIAISNAGIASLPNAQFGFRAECRGGRSVCLAWYRAGVEDYLLAFMDPENAGPLFPVSYAAWNDGKFREYKVVKFLDVRTKTMRVQVLINGEAQLEVPYAYSDFPITLSEKDGFEFGTSSPTTGSYIIDELGYGARREPLARLQAVVNSKPAEETTRRLLKPTWNVREMAGQIEIKPSTDGENEAFVLRVAAETRKAVAETAPLEIRGNREYLLLGEYLLAGEKARLVIRQFNSGYKEPEPPEISREFLSPSDARESWKPFEIPFCIRKGNDKIVLGVELAGDKSKILLRRLELKGGGPYRPPYKPISKELIPLRETVSQIVAARASESASVLASEGRNRLAIGDNPVAPCFHVGPFLPPSKLDTRGYFGMFQKAGIKIHEIKLPAESLYGEGNGFWVGPGKYNGQVIDDYLWRVLKCAPEARIILAITVDPYRAWGEENPDDVCMNQNGQKAYGAMHLSAWGAEKGGARYLPSVFSEKAARDISEMLTHLVDHVQKSPAGQAVIGYVITGFNDDDFGHWALPHTPEKDDYSLAAQKAFKKWLEKKYGGDQARLRRSWGDARLSFDSAQIPVASRRTRGTGTELVWFNSPGDQDLVDFHQFYFEAPVRLSSVLTKTVKERAGRNKIIMTYVGTPMHGWWYSAGGFRQAVDNPSVDLMCSPADYGIRLPGYPGGCDTLLESITLSGKIFMQEQDWRSFTVPTRFEDYDFGVGRAPTAAAHNAMVWRESGMLLARGHGTYFFDIDNGLFADPQIMNGITATQEVFVDDLANKGSPEADVALFLGETSFAYLAENDATRAFLMRLTRRQRPQWDTSGVPYHLYLQSDLARRNLPEYKVYILLSPQYLSDDEARQVEGLKRDGKTLVFLNSPGFIGAADPAQRITQITGIQVEAIAGKTRFAGQWSGNDSVLSRNLTGEFGCRPFNFAYGQTVVTGEFFAVNDREALPVAKFADVDKVAAAAKKFDQWQSIYCAIPWLDAQFLNNIAAWAGAWSVADPYDAVYANQYFICIHAIAGGLKTIRLRYPSRVIDMFTHETLDENVQAVTLDMKFGETRCLKAEPITK